MSESSIIERVTAPSAILFDWDDTLIQTWPYLWQLYQRTFQQFGKNILDFFDEDACKDYAVRNGRKTMIDIFGEDVGQKARDYFLKTYQEEALKHLAPLEDAKKMLDYLTHMDIPLGLVSNKESRFLNAEIIHMGFSGYFKSIVGRDMVGAKPSPDPVYYALKELGMLQAIGDHAHIWFIGDTKVDEETAAASGCTFIGFGPVFESSANDFSHHSIKSVANWNQFHSLLSEIHLKYA